MLRALSIVMLSLLAARGVLAQRAALPATAAGQALSELLARYNARETGESRWDRWYALYGPLEVAVVQESQPERVKAWLYGPVSRGYLGWDLRTSGAARPEVVVLQLNGALPPELRVRAAPVEKGALERELDDYLRQLEQKGLFSGVVSVRQTGKPLFEAAYGQASREQGRRNELATAFNLASVGKTFSAVAVLQLAQAGRLSLEDTVGKFLPDYPHASLRKATVRHLLLHQSGAGRSRENWIDDIKQELSVAALLPRTVAAPQFEPGTNLRHSNEGYVLLGRIIELASGQDYYAYIDAALIRPLGLRNTGFYRYDRDDRRVAHPYAGATRALAIDRNGLRGTPAGGLFASAADLQRFITQLIEGKILDRQHTALFLETRIDAPPPFKGTGFGSETGLAGGQRWIGKGGDAVGANTNWRAYPAQGYTVVVLSNYEGIADIVTTVIERMLLGE